MKLKTRIRTAVISHPNHPAVAVTAKQLTMLERIRVQMLLPNPAKIQGPEAIDAMVFTLRGSLQDWKGIEDSDGKPFVYAPESVWVLFEPELSCTVNGDEAQVPFGIYIAQKLAEEATFDADPLAPASAPS